MINKKILLVDPCSITHGPPPVVKIQDKSLSAVYSQTLDRAINKRLNGSADLHSQNAVSHHYISNYGLLILGGLFREYGFDVEYINGDYYINNDAFLNSAVEKAEMCETICFTATTPQYMSVAHIASHISTLFPNKLLVFGGPHAYFFVTHSEPSPFHLICVGHNAKLSSLKIKEMTIAGEIPVNSIVYLADGYFDSPKDFSLIPSHFLKETLLYSYVSFGCPNKCNYCVERIFSKKVCSLMLESKIQEIDFIVNKAKIRSVHLADSDFLLNYNLANDFLSLIERRKINCCFSINTSPRTICRQESLILLKRFVQLGLVEILIGIEYFSERELAYMNKVYSIDKLHTTLQKIRELLPELIISFYSLIGLPGEDSKTISENIKWTSCFKNDQLFDFSFPKFFVPYPGSDIFEHPDKYNVKILHRKWNEYHRWSLPRPIKICDMAENTFIDELVDLYNISHITIN
ncbi:MAG: radical SAM protein [Bacteroidales bacterium]|nr:radical SAM protein [Bacteroidales bacterium]